MKILKTIDENESMSNEISDIMSSADSRKKKARRLKALRDNCESSLARSHMNTILKYCEKNAEKLYSALCLRCFLCRILDLRFAVCGGTITPAAILSLKQITPLTT